MVLLGSEGLGYLIWKLDGTVAALGISGRLKQLLTWLAAGSGFLREAVNWFMVAPAAGARDCRAQRFVYIWRPSVLASLCRGAGLSGAAWVLFLAPLCS